MPSEAQSQEPRDRGPAPPVTRAGRSAQLAKAAATSPAPEKRPRGRPRKDGSGGRSAPPVPPTPPPPPPPPPKSRKKGRSRGRAQVEDEESMDATEKKTPQKTELKEKTPGRRRSTSRRKSNTNPDPEPSQNRLSPEPDPDPDPPHRDPTVAESSPEPPPSAEEEDRTSSAPAAPIPTSSPGRGPQVSPRPPSPDLSPVHSPASSPSAPPDPVEGDQPSPIHGPIHSPSHGPIHSPIHDPIHSPAPMEVDCNPSTAPMETEGGGASPLEQILVLSPCSSPPVSPCPRLDDEDSLSPLSEDSGASPTPSLGHTKKRLKQCAFCYRGDDPPLGQGRLVVFGPTPGYIPLHILNRRASSDRDSDCHDHCYRGDQALLTCSSPEQCEESSSQFVEQLGPVGLPHDINVQSLFDFTGQCCAHLQCAAWSEGVCRGEGQSLLYVDKAIDSGSTQVCAFCRRLGASLRCQEMSCGRSYHFPCAAAAGAHQDWTQRHTLCTRHTHTVSSQCVLCSGGGDVSGLLMCCCCGDHYHGSCLDPPLVPSSLCRAGWQCPRCRTCQSCRLRGDDGVLLVCDRCDKAYHTHCLTPPLDHTPSAGWTCKNCRICRRCGVRSSGQWANHLFLCESCDPALPCPLCDHAPDLDTPQDYLTCICCYRCVHTECVVQAGEGRAGSENYVCSACRPQEEELIPHTSTPHSPTLALSLSSTQAPSTSISQPPIPGHAEASPISHTAHSPVQLVFLEPPQSPTKTLCTSSQESLTPPHPEPSELQLSTAPPHPEPSELQLSTAPPHPEPSELQLSPAPSHPEPSELQLSPAPSHPELMEPQLSPMPSHPEPMELQPLPAPSHPEPSELQPLPAPSHPEPSELRLSPATSHPEPLELQLSPATSHPEPTEPQHSPAPSHPEPSELQHSPAPSHPDPLELQLSPEPSHPEPTEPQLSPAPTYTEPTELQYSPAPSHPDPLELHLSPASSNPEPTELQHSPAPSHPDPLELKHSPAPSHSVPTELQPSPAPSHPDPLELQHSPAPSHPEPEELPHSPAPSHSEHMELQPSPVPSHPEPTELQLSLAPSRTESEELQHSPVPSEPMELQHSPAKSHPELMELRHSLAPSNSEPEELRHGPEPSHPEPTVLQHTPEQFEPKELHHSYAPSHPNLTEVQHSPATSPPESIEHQHSPAPYNSEPMELQPSPAPSHPEPTEPQPSPAPSHPEPTEPQPSPAQSHPEPTELQHSPSPSHLEPMEQQPSPMPSHPEHTELQCSPAPSCPEQTDHQRSPVLSQPETSEFLASPATSSPEHTELQCSPAPSCPEQTDHQRSPAPTQPEPTEFECSSLLSGSNPKELQQSPLPSQLDPTELETSPSASYLDAEKEFQQSCTPSQPDHTEHQESHTSPHLSPAECQQSPTQSHSGPAQPLKSPMSCPEGTAELQKSPTHVTSTHAQHSPQQLICTSHSHTQNSTEDQLMATDSQLSPTQGFPMSRSYAHSPHSPTKTGLSPSQVLPGSVEPQQSLPPHSPVQDYTTQTQLNRLCSTDTITQPHHSPPQRRHSPITSPAHVGTSLPQSPAGDTKLTLDQESPGTSSPAQLRLEAAGDISTLDHDLSPVYLRSAQTPRRRTSLRPNSAPCSPSPAPLRATQCSLSQPASPVQVHSSQTVRPQLSLLSSQLATQSRVTKECTQTSTTEMKSLEHNPMQLSPNLDGQTLESCPAPDSHGTDGTPNQLGPLQSSALSPDHYSPLHTPAMPTPESLVHNSTSMEHSSLTCSPCADETEEIPPLASHIHQSPSGDSPSRCTESIEGDANLIHIQNSSASSRLKHTSQMPTSPARSPLACASPIQMVTSPAHVSTLVQPINPGAPPVKSLIQPASPSAGLARPAHTISCEVEEMEVAIDHPDKLTSHLGSSPDSSGHTSPVHTETNNGDSMMGSLHAQERSDPSVCRFASQSPTHHSQSSPSSVQSTCSPSQTSAEQRNPLSSPASFSPQHCRLTDANPASSSVSHSLSHSGQTTSHSVSVTDVTVIHSPPRSSPAGQASPVHIQSTSSSAHSGPVQRQTPSLASTPYSSPAPANIACVSPPHSPAQATYFSSIGSPLFSPRPDTGTSSGPTVAQLSPTVASPDVDLVASPVQISVLPSVVQLDSGLLRPVDSIRRTSPKPASSLIDDSSAVSPNQACPSPVSHTQTSPLHTTDTSAVESQQSNASGSPQYERSTTPVDATSTQSTLNHASPVHSSPTQDNTAMPSTCTTSETSDSSAPSQVSSAQTFSPQTQQAQASSVHSSPVASPDLGLMQSSITQINPSPVATSPVRPEACPSPGPGSPLRLEFSPVTSSVSPVFANSEQSETTPITGPTSPLQPDAGPGCPCIVSPQQQSQMEAESVATLDICMVQVQEEMLQERKTEEEKEMEREALQQGEVEDSYQTKNRPEEEELVDSTEGGEQELECAEDQHSSSNSPLAGVQLGSALKEDHQSSPHTEAAASPVLSHSAPHSPQTITPLSALPPQQPSFSLSSSPPASPFTSPQSPPLSRAGSLEASPSSPHRTALLTSCSPPLEVRPQEEELTNQRQAEMGKGVEAGPEDKTLSCLVTSVDDDSQSQSQFEPVARTTEPTKDKHQSLAEPSDREEELPETPEPTASHGSAASDVVSRQQPMREEEEEEQREGVTERMGEDQVDDAREGTLQEDQSDGEEEEPVSPVLELDPSLDMEVMELMASSPPPSLLHLSSPSLPTFSRRGKGRSLRPPSYSSRPSDDLAIRLRQSPFSTEASPETSPTRIPITPPPLSPLSPSLGYSPPDRESPPLSKPQAPTTVLPLTPKIGMGKPAITKRKFSPGRARIKQGSWWSSRRAVSPPSSSQDSMGEGGWDSPKPRPPDSPLWSMRVGRGSGFPGRRRSRGGGVGAGRGARGRSRLKTQDCLTVSPGSVYVEPFQPKEEEENSMHNTVVMFSTSDHFTLRQDMCVVCGSFGQGAEGRLLACSQCGQCYHPYCVNVKITRVVLTKGWRCLECTVCEACGEASDPGRLLLCDDCDISYHTYCLDPPLHTVPKGAWKCKWCVWCVQCGSSSPGLHCDWQNNYSRCGPCDSLSCCPLCQRQYSQDDLILQCQQCDRWVHAVCQGLTTEEEVEVAADEGFDCSLCRTHGRSSLGRSDSFESPYMAQIISRIREPDAKTYTQDGVCLTESGLSQLQSLVEPLTSPRRYRRCKPKLKLRIINQNSVSVLQTPSEPDPPTEQDPSRGDLECEMKSDSSPERDHAHDDDVTKEPEVTDGNKKRKRKPYRPGIGGFMVRQRGGKAGPSRIKLCRKDSTETLMGRDEDVSMETAPPADQTMEKVKKRYRKKKTKLEEAFPSYLQEAFFGRDLLDRSRLVDRRPGPETPGAGQSGAATDEIKGSTPGLHGLSAMTTNAIKKQGTLPMSEGALLDLSDVLNTDPHILGTGHTGQFQVERSPSPFAGLDISSMADDPSLTGSGGRGQRTLQEEPLDAILSPELDKMVTDGAILSKLYKIPELEGKDVEEVFTAVLSPNGSNSQSEQSQHTHTAAGSKTNTHHTAAAVFPRLPLMNGLMGAASHFHQTPMMPSGTQGPAGFRLPPPESPAPASLRGPAPGLASANQGSAGEGEQDVMSTAQRSMLKWEKEETLGEMATVAPVLYCNTNFPQLREQYPDWSTRVKQIAKLWRKASSQDRAPFVQKARDNRAAQRINKVQLSNDPLKRHQPTQPPPPPLGPYDPVAMEMEGAFKDPLRPKETEQEQEWKLRQGEVNDRWGAGKKRQENLPQSKALKSPTDKDCPYQASVAGGGKEALQLRQMSKQQAKMEATQKLEQVKNEQLLQQRQQQQLLAGQRLAGQLSPDTDSRSPVAGGNASPLHLPASREGQCRQHLLLQGGQSLGQADDVFLRPQAPPPSGFSSLPHSPHPSSPLHQPPSSPQMFSPPSSRPSSPWDPYSKVVGTPRPASSQAGGLPAPQQQQRRNSLSASPAHDAFGSPAPSPDSKPADISRVLGPQPGLQQRGAGMMSPSSGHVGLRAAETFQRTPPSSSTMRVAVSELFGRAGEPVQGGLFKAPMPPQHQPQPEVFGGTVGGRRDPSRPTDLPFALPQTQDPAFPSSPLSGLGSPHRSPYAQTPGTPRPDYSQQINDPFAQQSPLTSRPSPDPYANPQTPGTPRPHSDPTYLTTPPALRLDQFNQQSAGRRPSPSHPNIDPYSSNPGTPRPSISERFPRSPGSQRSADPYAQPVGTPRPSPDPYAQQPSTPRPQKAPEPFSQNPVESFTAQPAASCSSPLAGGLSGETFNMTHHQLQQSPGRQHQHQDSFPRTPSSQTPKHPGMLDESGFSGLAGQTPGHDAFEQGHMTPGTPQMDKTTANEMAALAVASLDGPMSMLPQLGDSEEKLRQRQRLRQLILRQQQQKSALRQEKGLQEAASGPPAAPPGPIPPSAPSRLWSQEDSSSAPPTDMFGRPPPPYPGTVRPGGAVGPPAPRFPGGFPGEQQRGFNPNKGSLPRQSLPRELGVRGPVLRFGLPPGPPAGLQDSFLHPPQGSVPGPVEFTGIRPLTAAGAHMMPGVPQQFLPRALPLQQHSIMGQPYIELRHRAPENRLRLPFPLPTADSEHSVQPGQGNRMGETPLGHQMVMEQQNQQHQQHLGHTATLTQSSESALPGGDGMEEHLEGEDSAVKDLEDVEVKDLVDLNLNLDPEDGKEDLDLGPNDLHLDDFLLSGKFDLIAYADPELNLEDKKDMFNEELDLGEQVEEKEVGERKDGFSGTRKTDGHSYVGQVKQEVQDVAKTEARDVSSAAQQSASQAGLVTTSRPPRPPGAQATKVEDSGSASGAVSQNQDQAPSSGLAPMAHPTMSGGPQSVFQQQQRPFGPSLSPSALFSPHPQGLLVSPHPSLTPQDPPAPPHQLPLQPSQPHLLLNPQTQPAHPGTSTQTPTQAVFPQNQNQDQSKNRPLLLEEQPLLLQDLLDQERQEQQQQKQMQALIRQRPSPESVLPNMDFDSISDPIMKAKMVALKGINKVMTQGTLGLSPMVINRFQQAPVAPVAPVAPGPEGTPQPPHPVVQDGKLNPQLVRPNPPSFGPGFVNESQRRQYEEWLGETQQLLQMQQRLLEDQIAAHRKSKKSLSAKQRTAKKAGRPFAEEDATQLRNITEQQGAVQKQLEQIRKQQKDHAELIEDYRSKQQQQRALQPAAPLLSQPTAPMQPRPGGPAPARAPNVGPGWPPGAGAPGVMAQRMPTQMPPALPNAPPAPPHTQSPPVMLPGLTAPTAGFPAGPRGPTGGPSGAAGDGASRQVNFDDNNPFSEGFQERERRERLREQQERQRVQLMQEVERHRALQQRLELEQQGLLGASLAPGAAVAGMPPSGAPTGARVGQTPGPGGPAGSAPGPGGDTLSQMPFFSSELPQDFLQSPPASRPQPQHQDQAGAPFAQQAGLHQGFTGGPLHPGAPLAPGLPPGATAELGRALPDHGPHIDVVPSNLQTRPRFSGPTGPSAQAQGHPAGIGSAGLALPHPGGQAHRFGHDSSSSSPSTPFPASFPCSSSGGPASLMQLYSDILPDDKTKKKRSRKRDGDDAAGGGGARTPLSSHSDDITAPPTPAVSDTSCSTPTRGSMDQSDLSFSLSSSHCGLAPSSELERQLSVISAAQQRGSLLGMDPLRGPLSAARLEVKEEREEGGACGGGVVKMEEGEGFSSPSPLHGGGKDGDAGKELLRHLLKDKTSPTATPSPNSQAPPIARRQLSSESVRSEEEDRPGSHGNMVNSPDLLDPSGRKKTQRCKRGARTDKDRAPLKNKRRKKEEEENKLNSSTSSSSDPLMTHLTQLAVLPLVEPVLRVDLSLFPPYGSSSLGRDSRLTGSFGNACLAGVTDYYSQLIYKDNLSNPPTPPASLPPTPPPVARQKLVNGFATTEELSRKDITEQDVKGVKQKGEGLLPLNHASKTVDVPASLPTPPHNNQEELRVQDSSDRDSPDGFVPSSSPESVADMEVSRYPDLSFIKLEPPSPCPSPTLPIMPCAWGKASALKQEVKAEPSHQGPPSCSNTDLVTIAITLNPVAAQNVAGVMAAVAELLRVPVPVDYQLSRPAGPERSSLALLAGVRVPLTQGSTGSRQQRPPPAAGNTGVRMNYIQHGGTAVAAVRPQCCNYCKGLLGNGVRIVKELKQEGQSKPGSSLVFCSPNCSTLYTSDLQSRSAGNKAAEPVTLSGSEGPPPSRVQHQYTNNMSSIAVHTLLQTPSAAAPTSSSPPLSFPPASTVTMETKTRVDSLKVKVKLKPRPRAVPGGEDSLSSRQLKRMKGCRWRRWGVSITLSRGPCIPNEAVAMPTEEEVDVLLKKLGACLRPDPLPKDQRRCCFCSQQGDGQTDGPARLLNLDLDLWVHLNCALWSSEVYETQAGALINVELALRRGLTLRCAHCQRTGATSGCNRLRCTNTYHFTCALQAHCTFFKDKTMLCHLHKPRMVPLSGDRSSSCSPSSTPGQTPDPAAMAVSDPYDSELRCFAVFRRVFVQRDEARQIAAVVQRGERQHTFRVGSLLFRSIGRLLPQQMNAFHNKSAIFPIGYHANRIYWSMRHSNRRCKYLCSIEEHEGRPLFKVKVVEKGYDDLIVAGPSPKAVWDQILEPVAQMRSSSGTLKLFPVYLKGEDLFGLTTSAVTRIIESLPGVETCERYTFRYGRNPLMEWPLAFNPSGSARSEPKAYQAKRPNLLTSVAPRCQGSVGSIVGLVPGVISLSPGETVAGAHQGRHSKSAQYRRMKADWKTNVYLARSRIQGLGLYAARDIEKCTMVIEYIGTIIRSEVANRKERLYESQNRGVYMFRIDNDFVIDATITGGPARYINHSCSPNCITEVVTVEKENKIIISSCRRIQRGEELSYDYKFDLEDDQHKIPCHCGAVNCRKWMN